MRQLCGCDNGPCPKAFDPEDGTTDVLIQGYNVEPSALAGHSSVPPGEGIVRIPREILLQAARALEALT